jgi:hypothetical protein
MHTSFGELSHQHHNICNGWFTRARALCTGRRKISWCTSDVYFLMGLRGLLTSSWYRVLYTPESRSGVGFQSSVVVTECLDMIESTLS